MLPNIGKTFYGILLLNKHTMSITSIELIHHRRLTSIINISPTRGAIGGKTGKTAVLPGFCKIECGSCSSNGALPCYRLGHAHHPHSAPASIMIDLHDQAEIKSVWIGQDRTSRHVQPDQIKSKNTTNASEEKRKNLLEVPKFRKLDVMKLSELVDHEDKTM